MSTQKTYQYIRTSLDKNCSSSTTTRSLPLDFLLLSPSTFLVWVLSTMAIDDPEDVLADSLESLYDHVPVTHSSAGTVFTYSCDGKGPAITLIIPDTQAANWSLHATSIWTSSLYIADHVADLQLDKYVALTKQESRPLRVLELGAGAGLPSILLAKLYLYVLVTCSDYPDPELIHTLSENAVRNDVKDRCRVVPYAWG